MTTATPHQTADRVDRAARRAPHRRRLAASLALVALLAAACSSGPGTEAELVEVLMRDGSISEAEATCIGEAVFDEYGDDEDALGTISAAPSFEFLSTDEGVPGFRQFFEEAVEGCLTVGPTTG